MVGGGATPSTWNFGSTGPRCNKIADFEPIIARSASAVTSSEKSTINANRKTSTRFPMSVRWSSYVAPKSPKGGLKNAKLPICVKNRTSLEESLLQSSFVWNCQRQSCKAFVGVTNRAKMIGGGWPLVPEILDQSDRIGAKSSIFARSASAVTFVWKLSRQRCKAFIALTNRAKMIGGRRPVVPEILSQWPRWSEIWTSCDNSETVRDRMSVTIY